MKLNFESALHSHWLDCYINGVFFGLSINVRTITLTRPLEQFLSLQVMFNVTVSHTQVRTLTIMRLNQIIQIQVHAFVFLSINPKCETHSFPITFNGLIYDRYPKRNCH